MNNNDNYLIDLSCTGQTLWVNCAESLKPIAKFSTKFGMEVYLPQKDGIKGKYWTHGKANIKQWEHFINLLKEFYNIEIDLDDKIFKLEELKTI